MSHPPPRAANLKRTRPAAAVALGGIVLVASCGSPSDPGNGLPSPSVACASQPVTTLSASAHTVIDLSQTSGCLRLPAAQTQGAQYLLALVSTNGTKSSSGIQGTYHLRSSNPVSAAVAPAAPRLARETFGGLLQGSLTARFEAGLRRAEAALAADPRNRPGPLTAPPRLAAPPLGDVKSFKACANLACTSVVTVQATARYVGTHVAVYLDNEVPQNDPLQDSDLANLGTTFDNYHYPIDNNAFGTESDIDGNGVVIILMTDAVNDLTPDCTDGRVIGYFFGGDLLVGANSNRAEIFFTLVPAPAKPNCTAVTRSAAVNNLKPTLIHEFQHMISFNQHVLVRASPSEEVWLNEALSHFAEELGGRLIPDAQCTPAGYSSCRAQYSGGNILNAYDYLKDTESEYMFFPTSGQGTLPERGAVWLFLRWVLDQFEGGNVLGTATTRALVGTSQTGITNVTAVTGGDPALMVPRWQLANYLDDGTELPSEPTGFLRYTSWGLRGIWTDPRNASTFPNGFPLVPAVLAGTVPRNGNLKAGSGKHFMLTQTANGLAVDIQVLKNSTGAALDPQLQARIGVVRIR